MFTGLIESVGRVSRMTPVTGGVRIEVATPLAPELAAGDSLAVNGVCLTVVAPTRSTVSADVSPETLRVTALGRLEPGAPVNLERPLRADGRLGGHVVQGHVDATGRIEALEQEGEFYRVRIAFPPALAPLFVTKGSVAVDGISLTVAALGAATLDVQIIPHTWTHTTLGEARAGDPVNIECDLVGKYVVRLAELGRAGSLPAAPDAQGGTGPETLPQGSAQADQS
jgi:riboflavin synthase